MAIGIRTEKAIKSVITRIKDCGSESVTIEYDVKLDGDVVFTIQDLIGMQMVRFSLKSIIAKRYKRRKK